MSPGTLDRTPPPFFRQGTPALTKLAFCSALAVFLMVADARFGVTLPLRALLATVLLPVERALLVPVDLLRGGSDYLHGLGAAVTRERRADERLAVQSLDAARASVLERENAELRRLLGLSPQLAVPAIAAEVMYQAADPFSRKLVIDRGAGHGVVPGSPVVNEAGVLGQVTRVYPLSAEVTLLADKDAAIPVLNARTRQRGAAYGSGSSMELRFVSANADVQPGDPLETSGLDGVYPPGLQVARVARVERRAGTGFARVELLPAAAADAVRHVLVLQPLAAQFPPVHEGPAAPPDDKPAPPARRKAGTAASRAGAAAARTAR